MDDNDLLLADAVEATPEDFENFVRKVNEADTLISEIAGVQATLDALSAKLSTLVRFDLPQLMNKAQVTTFTTTTGREVALKTICGGTWPKDDEKIEAAIKWLEDEKLDDNLKASIHIDFNKEDRSTAKERFETLRGDNVAKSVTYTEAVHSSTLTALFKRLVAEGKTFPLEPFNGFVGSVVQIAEPKVKKPRKASASK